MRYGPIANETDEYRKARAKLLEEEIALRDQRERVAKARRSLPADTPVEDYVFHEGSSDLEKDGPLREVRLSELFEDETKPLIVYQFMYGGAQKNPCPMCSMWTDGFNGVARHLRQRSNFAVVAEAKIEDWRRWGRKRNWNNLRLVSSNGSTFKTDLQFEDGSGVQHPGLSVFVRSSDGSPKHFYSMSAYLAEKEYRGLDLYSPVWHLLDVTPGGREDWMPSLEYE